METECPECKRVFPDELVRHLMMFNDRREKSYRLMCPLCANRYTNAVHHQPQGTPFKAPIARRMFDKAMDHVLRSGQKLEGV